MLNISDLFIIVNGAASGGLNSVFYNKGNGIVRTHITGGSILRAGTKFCMEYTK